MVDSVLPVRDASVTGEDASVTGEDASVTGSVTGGVRAMLAEWAWGLLVPVANQPVAKGTLGTGCFTRCSWQPHWSRFGSTGCKTGI